MALATLTNNTPFFKMADHVNDLAIIFEPKSYRENVPTDYGDRTFVQVYVTIFRTSASLKKGKPDFEGMVTVNDSVPADQLSKALDAAKKDGDDNPALIYRVGQVSNKKATTKYWSLIEAREDDKALAVKFYEDREAALNEVPDFE